MPEEKPAAGDPRLITPAVISNLKQALHDVVALYHGHGNITLMVRQGVITRIVIEVDAWRIEYEK